MSTARMMANMFFGARRAVLQVLGDYFKAQFGLANTGLRGEAVLRSLLDQGSPLTPEQQQVIDLDWRTTVAEDFDLMDSVQRGVRSRGYRPGPLITDPSGGATIHSEDTIPHLHTLLTAALDR